MPDVWQPVEGVAKVQILALLNKPSITNSNAYLLRTDTRLLIFDPGADPAQVDRLNAFVAAAQEESPREPILLLTHAHLDHFAAAERLRAGPARPRTIMHAAGADAIHRGDRHHTLAILYRDVPIPDLPVDATLFGPVPSAGIRREQWPGPDGEPVPVEFLPLEPGLELEIHATPGHSTCGCAFRIGRHLILGDLPFGASPGLAGLAGWSSRALGYSIRLVRQLIRQHEIAMCWVGHGRSISGPEMLAALHRMEKELATLGGIAALDEDRITLLRYFAVEILHELERLFAVIGARLLIVAYRLEELEEPAEAERLRGLTAIDEIETQLADLRQFCRAFERGEEPELSVAMKAAATLGRIRRTMAASGGDGGGTSLVSRAEDLMDDFLQTIRGLSFRMNLEPVDLAALVSALLAQEQSDGFDAEDAFSAVDDEDAFRDLLVRSLSSGSTLRGHVVSLRHEDAAGPYPAIVVADVQRLREVLLSTLEALAGGSGARSIEILVTAEAGQPALRINGGSAAPAVPAIRAQLYRRAMLQMGGDYAVGPDAISLSLQAAPSS